MLKSLGVHSPSISLQLSLSRGASAAQRYIAPLFGHEQQPKTKEQGHDRTSLQFSFKWWQQCAAAIRGPRIGSARSKPLSRSEIKVQASREILGMARRR